MILGVEDSPASLVAAIKGYRVLALDLNPVHWSFIHPAMEFIKADINALNPEQPFDLIISCSTIEHIGLRGRYGEIEESDRDLKTMKHLLSILKLDGVHLMTIPVGVDKICAPYHRIYGIDRLPRLLDSYKVSHEEYWTKRPGKNLWIKTTQDDALQVIGSSSFYSLGLFVLMKK